MIVADTPGPSPSPILSPALASTPGCAVPNAPPRAVNVVRPAGAEHYLELNPKSGIVDIKVYLAADGSVSKAVILRSSGDPFLDGATYDAAVATTYAPEIRTCQAIAGAYIYRTKYNASPASALPPAPTPAPTA